MANNDPKVVDEYIESLNPLDDALLHALKESDANGLPPINVSPNEGRLLYILAKMAGAKKILELGILGGFSTINLARALPEDGKLLSLEYVQKHADVARANIDYAGLGNKVEIRVGAGLDLLHQLIEEGAGPFDLFFIDADKENYPGYLDLCLRLARPGSVILSDNLIRDGKVLSPEGEDINVRTIAQYNKTLHNDPRLETIIVPLTREYI
ncbi:MAG: O-methyltransferase, partial [Chloroflexia bacterium]